MDLIEALIRWWDGRAYGLRTVVPGKVTQVTDQTPRERVADFQTGIADLVGGEPAPADKTPSAPVMMFSGGGFFTLMPTTAGDEMLGLVADRATGDWRTTRQPGNADPINGARHHAMHDILLTPFSITAPSGAPETWDHWIAGGPAGVAIDIEASGAVTLTKAGTPVATLTLNASGGIVLTPAPGQSVEAGGSSDLTLANNLITVMDAVMAALVAAGAGPTYAGAGAAQTAWNAGKNTIKTTTTKGQ